MDDIISEGYTVDKFFSNILNLSDDEFVNYGGEGESFQPSSRFDHMDDVISFLRMLNPIKTKISFSPDGECEFTIVENLASDMSVSYKASADTPEEASIKAILQYFGFQSVEELADKTSPDRQHIKT